jgi:hypothetical protein
MFVNMSSNLMLFGDDNGDGECLEVGYWRLMFFARGGGGSLIQPAHLPMKLQ